MATRTAIILGAALVLAAMAHGGLYGMIAVGAGGASASSEFIGERGEIRAYLFNRFTGSVAQCDTNACARALGHRDAAGIQARPGVMAASPMTHDLLVERLIDLGA